MTDPIHDYDPAQALEGREAIAVFIADALMYRNFKTPIQQGGRKRHFHGTISRWQ